MIDVLRISHPPWVVGRTRMKFCNTVLYMIYIRMGRSVTDISSAPKLDNPALGLFVSSHGLELKRPNELVANLRKFCTG